jgi:hypothetical protein
MTRQTSIFGLSKYKLSIYSGLPVASEPQLFLQRIRVLKNSRMPTASSAHISNELWRLKRPDFVHALQEPSATKAQYPTTGAANLLKLEVDIFPKPFLKLSEQFRIAIIPIRCFLSNENYFRHRLI